jgi:polar amino acid transport system substrate-binding protein
MARLRSLALIAACAAALATACGGSSGGTPNAGGTTPAADACAVSNLQLRTPGTLTIGGDDPVFEPWYVNNSLTNGKGFEDAVAYAVAKQMGFDKAHVKWVRVGFNQVIGPQPKNFDIDFDQVSITPKRARNVDFSAPYYDVVQAVVSTKGSKADGVTTLAGLRSLKLGAQVGSTSYDTIVDQIKPSQQPGVYNTNSDALNALKNGGIDGLVVDLPTAFYMSSAQLKDGIIVGQIPEGSTKLAQLGIVLDLHSPLTPCVSKAVNALRAKGVLARLQKKWLASVAHAPVLH